MVSFPREQNQYYLQPNTGVRHFAIATIICSHLLAGQVRGGGGGGGGG